MSDEGWAKDASGSISSGCEGLVHKKHRGSQSPSGTGLADHSPWGKRADLGAHRCWENPGGFSGLHQLVTGTGPEGVPPGPDLCALHLSAEGFEQ